MKLARYLFLPALIAIVALIYLVLAGEYAGATMLIVFIGASALFMWILVPTVDHEGNTAPIDPDFPGPKD